MKSKLAILMLVLVLVMVLGVFGPYEPVTVMDVADFAPIINAEEQLSFLIMP